MLISFLKWVLKYKKRSVYLYPLKKNKLHPQIMVKNKRRKVFHLLKKNSDSNFYYGSLTAVFNENKDLGVSKYKLDRWNFSTPFENSECVLIKDFLKTSTEANSKNKTK